jgi:hypothetical protein
LNRQAKELAAVLAKEDGAASAVTHFYEQWHLDQVAVQVYLKPIFLKLLLLFFSVKM